MHGTRSSRRCSCVPKVQATKSRCSDTTGRPNRRSTLATREWTALPYWSGWFTTHAGPAGRELVAVNSLYPVHRYGSGGEHRGTLGGPSSSFRLPSQPERWAFGGPDGRDNYDAWLKSFTTIAGIHALSDSLVVVVLEDLNPEESAFAESSYRADVFDLESGQVLGRDLPLPGRVVEADEVLYVAVRDPERGWRVELFDLELNQ